jgi:hypothetical protein
VLVCYTERIYKASIFFYSSVCAAMFVKKSEVHILYHKELAHARILRGILVNFIIFYNVNTLSKTVRTLIPQVTLEKGRMFLNLNIF